MLIHTCPFSHPGPQMQHANRKTHPLLNAAQVRLHHAWRVGYITYFLLILDFVWHCPYHLNSGKRHQIFGRWTGTPAMPLCALGRQIYAFKYYVYSHMLIPIPESV